MATSLPLSLLAPAYSFVTSHRLSLAAFPFSATAALRFTSWLYPTVSSVVHHCTLLYTGLTLLAVVLVLYITSTRVRAVYLVDYACFRPPAALRVPLSKYIEHTELAPCFDDKSVGFQSRLIERSGFGEETCLPPACHVIPPEKTLKAARAEAEQGIFSAVDAVLAKTGVCAEDIGVVVVNCTLFAPTPSMADMVVRRYGLRSDVRCFSLSGMGCSAGMAGIGLAENILQCHSRCRYALVVSTEILTGLLLRQRARDAAAELLFRLGASAVLLSASPARARHARYRLARVVRTHAGHDDRAYGCVQQEDDAAGERGIALSKDVMPVAGDTLKEHMTTLGPLVLPASELLAYALVREAQAAAPGGAGGQQQAAGPRLPHGVRALLHPRGRPCGDRRAAARPRAVGQAGGAVAHGAAPVRQHVEQLDVVRAGLPGGQVPRAQGRPCVDGRVWVRVQVQQRGVGVHPVAGSSGQRAMGGLHASLPGGHGPVRLICGGGRALCCSVAV
ncbi:hypothetical protein ZWY2020_011354 [Hordeum vulgare]|nr:hypothetical protein ZWY2020_011354 [Hordeum vulgare]